MARLTKKTFNEYTYKCQAKDLCDKLGKLEDVEDKIGIDLLIMLKAVHGFYFITENNLMDITCGDYGFGAKCREMCIMSNGKEFRFRDYNKTWSVDREVIERIMKEKENEND